MSATPAANGSAGPAANGSAVALPKGYKEVPLSKGHVDDPRGGSLLLYSHTEFESLKDQLNGVFSFVYYYKPKADNRNAHVSDFLETLWYKGLQFYLNIVHDPHGTIDRGEAAKAELFSRLKTPDGNWTFIDRSKQKSGGLGGITWGPNDIEIAEEAMKTPPLSHEEAVRFESWGVVIYTDVTTQALLRGVFPLEKYPKLVIAVVNWPYYSIEGGVCEYSIMRTMRFQSTELFQGKTICVRDADTIFVKSLEYNPDYIQYLILWWESEFLKPWTTEYNIPKKPEDPWMYDPVGPIREKLSFEKYHLIEKTVIIGTMNNYRAEWHTNLPGPYPVGPDLATYRQRDPWKPYSEQVGNQPRPPAHHAHRGVFAGFVNISRKNTQPLWTQSVNYLLQRYFIALYSSTRVISDIYCRSITGAHIGKDERILLFVYPSAIHRYNLEYYYIEYSSVVSTHGNVINALSWPIELMDFHGGGGQKLLISDHLLTPYYNKGVYKTAVKMINEELKETMDASYEQYGKFISAMNFPKESMKAADALQECNPRVAKEDLFLKEAGFLSPEVFAGRLEEAVPSLNNLRRTQKAKQDAINKKFGIVRSAKPRRRRTRKT